MSYTRPKLIKLLSDYKHLKESCSAETEDRRKMAATLEAVSAIIDAQLGQDETKFPELNDGLLGAYLYTHDKINQEYYLHSPEFQSGRIYSSGSQLYSHLSKALELSDQNKVSAREQLIYINKFHQFVKSHQAELEEKLGSSNTHVQDLLISIRAALVRQLTLLTNPIAKIENAIPTELAVTKHMNHLPADYAQARNTTRAKSWFFSRKPNQDNVFLAQLAKAVSSTPSEEDESELPANGFTRSQRIKMGALLYIEKSIASKYYFRSPRNSHLYRESIKILNMTKEENLDNDQQLACINAFKSYIDDNQVRLSIEQYGNKLFGENNLLVNVDAKLGHISREILSMQRFLESSLAKQWPTTATFATVGMILGAAPGYGIGSFLGTMFSQGNTMRPFTSVAGNGVGHAATVIFGETTSAGFYSLSFGNMIVASILSRGFAKVFELVGMAAGGVVGGSVGFTFDLTHKVLQDLCIKYLNYYDHHPDQMRNADTELVKCLLELPAEIFATDKKNQLLYTAGMDNEEEQQSKFALA